MTKVTAFCRFSKHKIKSPNILSALRPVPHDDSVPVLRPPESYSLDDDSGAEEPSPEETGPSPNADPDFSTRDTSEPHLISQAELND
jgi:hypothetical protein